MKQLSAWLIENDLVLNITKTCAINFSTIPHQLGSAIQIENNSINLVESVKFLGIEINKKLNWSSHILQLCRRLSSICYAIKSVQSKIGSCAAKNLYHACFESIIRYGIILWGNSPTCIKLFRIQKRIVRALTNAPHRAPCRDLFRKLEIMTLPSLYIFELLCYVKEYGTSWKMNSELHNYNTRQNSDFHMYFHRTFFSERLYI